MISLISNVIILSQDCCLEIRIAVTNKTKLFKKEI